MKVYQIEVGNGAIRETRIFGSYDVALKRVRDKLERIAGPAGAVYMNEWGGVAVMHRPGETIVKSAIRIRPYEVEHE